MVKKMSGICFSEEKRKETRLNSLAKLLGMSTGLFGTEKDDEQNGKNEGSIVQINFLALGYPRNEDGSVTMTKSNNEMIIRIGPSENAKAILSFKMKEEEMITCLADILSTKANIFGLGKFFLKYVIPNKIRFTGSIKEAAGGANTFMLGSTQMYKDSKVKTKDFLI